MKLFEIIDIGKEREIRLLGKPICEYGCRYFTFSEKTAYEKYFDIFPSKGVREAFFDGILSQLNDDYDDIYISRMAAIGDTYFLSFMFENWVKKNNSKKPVLVVLNDNAKKVFNLFSPNIECKKIDFNKRLAMEIFYNDVGNKGFSYKNKRFFSYINKQIILDVHNKVKDNINTPIEDCSFVKILSKYYAEFYSKSTTCNISEQAKNELLADLEFSGLNLDKFIFISPEASSNCSYDTTFWIEICKRLRDKDYDIFINSSSDTMKIPDCVCGLYDIEQTYYLAQMSKGIISLRSGLNDVLSTINVPHHILYTRFKCNIVSSASENILAFSLKYLPNVNQENISEYDTDELTSDEIIDEILREFD